MDTASAPPAGTGTGTGTTVVVSFAGGADAGTFWLHPIRRSAAPASAVRPKYPFFMRTLKMLLHASDTPSCRSRHRKRMKGPNG